MKTKLITLVILFIFQISLGQISKDIIFKSVSSPIDKNSFRVSFGLQKKLLIENCLAKPKVSNLEITSFAYKFSPSGYYSTYESDTKTKNFKVVYDFKVGQEYSAPPLLLEPEVKCLNNFEQNNFFIIPNISLGNPDSKRYLIWI